MDDAAIDAGFRSVVFDCDSTLVSIEGIDELAPGDAVVADLTRQAMEGERSLESVYGARLEHVRPDRKSLDRLGEQYVASLVADSEEVVAALRHLGKEVRIISGGIRAPVTAVARYLGLSDDRVAAVDVHLGPDGAFAGFDAASPLTRTDGKAEVIEAWGLPRPSMLVGDGMSDLAARPAVDAFVAFAGVARRPRVEEQADRVLEGPGLAGVLALACSAEERERLRLGPWEGVLRRGERGG